MFGGLAKAFSEALGFETTTGEEKRRLEVEKRRRREGPPPNVQIPPAHAQIYWHP